MQKDSSQRHRQEAVCSESDSTTLDRLGYGGTLVCIKSPRSDTDNGCDEVSVTPERHAQAERANKQKRKRKGSIQWRRRQRGKRWFVSKDRKATQTVSIGGCQRRSDGNFRAHAQAERTKKQKRAGGGHWRLRPRLGPRGRGLSMETWPTRPGVANKLDQS